MDDVNRYIDTEILQNLSKGFEFVQYSQIARAIRVKAVQCLDETLPTQERPDFYERVLQSCDQLAEIFDISSREEPHIPGPPFDEMKRFQQKLKNYALPTEHLLLSYYKELCQEPSPV